MRNIKEKDVDSGTERDFTNFRIRTKLLSSCSGAGVNAELGDPLSELVLSAHSGLSLKCANPGADLRKPFLLWNVGPESPFRQQRITGGHGTVVSQTHAHASHSESTRKFEEDNCMLDREADPLTSPRAVQTDESRKGIAEVEYLKFRFRLPCLQTCKEASPAVVPLKKLESSAENDCGLGGAELPRAKALPAEGSCMGSWICLYPDKGKGKALLDGDIHGRSSDSAESSHSAGHSMKGVKREIWDEGDILGSKRMKKQIHGSAFVIKPDSSFMKWISNMTTTKEDSLSPLPLACATDADAYNKENFMCFKPRGPAPAPISMGFRAMFQSLYSQETDELSAGGKKKIVESLEVSREVEVHDEKSPENNVAKGDALGEETKIGASPGRSGKPRTSLWITSLATNTLRSEKGKEIIIEESSDLDSQAGFQVKPVLPPPHSHRDSSEAMASVFARRLDALRHMTRSKEAPRVTKSEVEDLKLKLSAFRVEKSCIRCCGKAPRPSYGSWKPIKDADHDSHMQNRSEMLAAIRNLRLSRADILRWMNSDVPLSHLNGFSVRLRLRLRLRLGNHEAGSYYVGCISYAAGEVCTSRKCISVDIGGMKSSVPTRYVSNHDFLEDEIKAWWTRIIRSGCRLPSLDHLNSIFNHRQTLRF